MISYAFKVAAESGSFWSRMIAWRTGGKYSHVEIWLKGPATAARCFSSREGSGFWFLWNGGAGFRTIDLTVPGLWDIVPWPSVTEAQEQRVMGFCEGQAAAAVRYDWLADLGIAVGSGDHDDHDRMCAESGVEVPQTCLGWWPGVERWTVSPSDLFRMASAMQP